jgi:hypothetical protein
LASLFEYLFAWFEDETSNQRVSASNDNELQVLPKAIDVVNTSLIKSLLWQEKFENSEDLAKQ